MPEHPRTPGRSHPAGDRSGSGITTSEFAEQEITAGGLLARVILHEIDHLNGVLFIDHLNAVKRKLLRGRLNKISNGEVEVDYPIVGKSSETA